MSFRWFIYYCALLGGCSAYVGWVLGRIPPVPNPFLLAAVRGLALGLALALGLTLVDATFNPRPGEGIRFSLRLLVGGLSGAIGGFVGGLFGQALYTLSGLSLFLVVGWSITGLLIGASPGLFDLLHRLSAREETRSALRKVINGVIGGSLGGILGGLLYLGLRNAWDAWLQGRADEFWSPSATGFVALGMCIGLLIGLAQVILMESWVRVEAGFRPGRELILSAPRTLIGRAEGCDIPMFGDSGIEKEHATLLMQQGRVLIEDLGTRSGTFVNGRRIGGTTVLKSGDLIEIGRSSLRFGEQARRSES